MSRSEFEMINRILNIYCGKLEAEKGFIRLSLKRKKQFLLLNVENSFDGNMPLREEDLLPITTKQNALPDIVTEHEIGLENVRDMSERYFGGVDIKVKGDVFHVTIMLQQGEKTKINKQYKI